MNIHITNNLAAYLSAVVVFFRILGFFLLVPAYSHKSLPMMFKLLFAVSLSLALFPILRSSIPRVPGDIAGIVEIAIRETLVGLLMGFVARVTFEGIHLAAQYAGTQIGFGAAGLVDPVNQAQTSVLVPLAGWMALMVFMVTNMHHDLLALTVRSYELTADVTVASIGSWEVGRFLIDRVGALFVVAVKIAAPFTLLVLASNCAVGILSRLIPQMHMILFVFPVTILLGMVTLYLFAPELLDAIETLVLNMGKEVVLVLRTL